jgi:hypothetical protein
MNVEDILRVICAGACAGTSMTVSICNAPAGMLTTEERETLQSGVSR